MLPPPASSAAVGGALEKISWEPGDLDGAKERLQEARGVMKSLGLNDAAEIDKTLNELG